jgi:hypothetical protein
MKNIALSILFIVGFFASNAQINYDSLYRAYRITYSPAPQAYGYELIIPQDTVNTLNFTYLAGALAYKSGTVFAFNGSNWQSVGGGGGGSYSAGYGLGLTGTTFYVDTTVIPNLTALADTADTLRSYTNSQILANQAGFVNYYFDTAHIGTYRTLTTAYTYTAQATTYASITNGQVLDSFITAVGVPNQYTLRSGIYDFHIHASQTGGTKTTQLYFQLFTYDTTGTQTLVLTTGYTNNLVGISGGYDANGSLPTSIITNPKTRYLIKVIAYVTGGGSAPTVQFLMKDNTLAGMFAPSQGVSVDNFVPYSGGVKSLNLTGYTVTADTVFGKISSSYIYPTPTSGTVTSVGIAGGTGISVSGSPVTSSGIMTVTATGSLSAGTGISVSGSFPTYTVTNTSPSSGGTVTSFSASDGSPVYSVSVSNATTTPALTLTSLTQSPNTFLAGASTGTVVATPTFRAITSTDLPTLTTTINGVVATIGSVGTGTFTSGGASTGFSLLGTPLGASGGSSGQVYGIISGSVVATTPPSSGSALAYGRNGAFQWDSTGYQAGAQWVLNSSGDLYLLSHSSASAPATSGAVYYSSNLLGISELHSVPYLGAETIYQNEIGRMVSGWITIGSAAFQGFDSWQGSSFSTVGSTTIPNPSYDATNALPNKTYGKLTSASSTNSSAEIYISSASRPIFTGTTKYGNGGKLILEFGFNTYASSERFFAGYAASNSSLSASTDPSSFTNIIGVGKDAADGTLQVMYNAGSGTATKVNTSITPNANDYYIVTIYLPSNTTTGYVTVEDYSKTGVTVFSSSNSAKVGAITAGTAMYAHLLYNTGASSTAVNGAIIKIYGEQL